MLETVKNLWKVAFLFMFVCLSIVHADELPFASRTDVSQFIDLLVKENHFKRAELETILNQVQLQPTILEKMQKPYEEKPWFEYRNFFITDVRVIKGVEFWKQHEAELNQAEKKYGVPAEVIVAVLGIETYYGTNLGDYRVLDTLATLAFNYPQRSEFFRRELQEFLLLAREQNFTVTEPKGSYAGAMGYPQFMPSSYRRFAVDFTGNGHSDLLKSASDAIGSIANYLKENGWVNEPVFVSKATVTTKDIEKFLEKPKAKSIRYRPQWRLRTLAKQGITPNEKLNPELKATLVDFEEPTGKEYWLGLQNFYVITRYNASPNYSMVVIELSKRLKSARAEAPPRIL